MTYGRYEDNDGRFPDGANVEVLFPAPGQDASDRSTWSWMPAVVLGQCGPDEWQVAIEARELFTLADGSPALASSSDEEIYAPVAWRDSSELRLPRTADKGAAR